jgi:hypothetical protein
MKSFSKTSAKLEYPYNQTQPFGVSENIIRSQLQYSVDLRWYPWDLLFCFEERGESIAPSPQHPSYSEIFLQTLFQHITHNIKKKKKILELKSTRKE